MTSLKRIFESIFAFFIWILIALVTILSFIVIAIIRLFDWTDTYSYYGAMFWGHSIVKLNPFWKIRIIGRHHIKKNQSYVLVANHSSLADIVCLYCLNIHFKWIAKSSLFKIPFLGWSMSLLGYIPLSRGKHGSIRDSFKDAQKCLTRGRSVLIFPEGTRSRTGRLSLFKNGAFKLALLTKKPIVPILIKGTSEALSKGKATMASKVEGSIKVLPPIDVGNYKEEDFEELKTKVWNLMEQELSS